VWTLWRLITSCVISTGMLGFTFASNQVSCLLRLPHLGRDEAAGVFIRDMEQEAGLLLNQLDGGDISSY